MPSRVRFDCFEVDLSAGQLCKRGVRINLRDKSFQVLTALLKHPGEVVSRDDLCRQLWRDDVFVDFDNNLNTVVARLREALGDSADQPKFIETLPKRGYRFLENVYDVPKQPQPSASKRIRLAVLPFLNLCGDSAQDYFSDAFTDEVITGLADLAPDQLAVIARTTTMHYKGSRKDVARIGRELAVDYVVEGAVNRSPDEITVNVQLIQVSDQAHLYAKRYTGLPRDVFSLQSSIARAIAERLDLPASIIAARSVSAAGRAVKKPTEDLEAYDAYLKGHHYLGTWTPDGLFKSKQFFEAALARDPEFALAHDGLAEAYWWMGFLGLMRPKDAFSIGVFSALRALEIDHTLAPTHALLGTFRKELDYNWPEVQREMALALKLDPLSPIVHFGNGGSGLMPQGRLDESIAEIEFALEFDPLSLFMRAWLGETLYLARKYERAKEQCRLLKNLDPLYFHSYFVLGQVFTEEATYDEALPALNRAAELSGNAPLVVGWLGMSLAKSGDRSGAQKILADLHAASTQVYILPTTFAWIHLGLGEIDEAYLWLERAIEERDPIIIPIKTLPFLDPLRTDPRFVGLLRTMRLDQ